MQAIFYEVYGSNESLAEALFSTLLQMPKDNLVIKLREFYLLINHLDMLSIVTDKVMFLKEVKKDFISTPTLQNSMVTQLPPHLETVLNLLRNSYSKL